MVSLDIVKREKNA